MCVCVYSPGSMTKPPPPGPHPPRSCFPTRPLEGTSAAWPRYVARSPPIRNPWDGERHEIL